MLFQRLAEYFEKIEKASSRLEMTELLAELFRKTNKENVRRVIYLAQGGLGAKHERKEIGLGEKLVMEAMAKSSGYRKEEIAAEYREKGDLGLVAEKLAEKRRQKSLFTEKLTIEGVFGKLKRVALSEGKGSKELKLKRMAELFNSASPVEAKYLARIPLENLRLGIGDPTIMDAFAIAFLKEGKKDKRLLREAEKVLEARGAKLEETEVERQLKFKVREKIEEKYNIHSDLGGIAELLKEKGLKGLEKVKISPGIPIRPTLAERLSSSEEIVKKIGKCAVEAKYDGFRLSVHKDGEKVVIFSRQSENVTEMFPEITEAVKEQVKAKEAIFEGEALAVNEETQEYRPFQVTMQRKRKYGVNETAKKFPLKLFVFDLMYADGKNLMNEAFKKRRPELEKILKKGGTIELTDAIVTDNPKKIDKFFQANVEKGLEGIIAKDLNARYVAGARKFAWIKLKRSYKGELSDSVDAVILGYFKGRGKRAQFGLGGLLTGVYSEKEDKFKSIAKIGTGMSEKMLQKLEASLKKISVDDRPARVESELKPDKWVDPKYVIEVRADEITKSPVHTAGRREGVGFALRFPRMIKLRADRKPEEATTEKEIEKMFKAQKIVGREEK